MSEMIGLLYVNCPKCYASGVPHVGRYVWYHNQHGSGVRVFCYCCGTVADKNNLKGLTSVTIQNWKVEIKYPRTEQEDLPF